VLFRLYRAKKECAAHGAVYVRKTALARERVDLLCTWLPRTACELLLDRGYANRTVLRGRAPRVRVFAAIDARAALTDAAGRTLRTGGHSAKGAPLGALRAWAADPAAPWTTEGADVYGGARTVVFKTRVAQWWHVCGAAPLRGVVLQCTTGAVALRAFLCTDPACDATAVRCAYARRWAIETYFFEVKPFLGLCASRARTELAVRRFAPCVGLLYGVLVVWFWDATARGLEAVIPARPWYGHKAAVSFEDILRTARVALAPRPLRAQVTELAPLRRATRRGAAASAVRARCAA
jgi:hypothetical protein